MGAVTLVTTRFGGGQAMMTHNSSMKKLKFVVSLTTADNDYQQLQGKSAEQAARQLGVELEIIHAENDAIVQSQQLLKIIQSRSDSHPDGIIFEPVGGTAFPLVARAAAAGGIGWAVLNRDVDYISELRRAFSVPMFAITSDHEEIGRIQGRQIAALLPNGGSVLCIEGPSQSTAAKQRTSGLLETKPANVQVKVVRGQWTEESGRRAISSWLRLSTSQHSTFDLIAAQDDSMAVGAKKAFQELTDSNLKDRWLGLPFIGCDGGPETGQAWVRRGLLTATVVVPANTGQAIEMLVKAIQTGVMPTERSLTVPTSFPMLENLASTQAEKARVLAAGRP
jgi:ribose transport system substrate-binding protein